MTVLAVWPFYSQIDRITRKFKLSTCGAAKQLSYIGRRVQEELGWRVKFLVPDVRDSVDEHPWDGAKFHGNIPVDNVQQRVEFSCAQASRFLFDADVVLCNHELIAAPLRYVLPKLKLVQMCSVAPLPLLSFQAAWDAADLVVAQGDYAAQHINELTTSPVVAWKLAYDAEELLPSMEPHPRPIDVLFVQRCSSTNYTHHMEFVKADLSGLVVEYVDVTNYLKQFRPELRYTKSYTASLYGSRFAVALNNNLYGGLSIREAIRAGCVPIVLRAPCYEDLVGEAWPHFVEELSPRGIESAVRMAVEAREFDMTVPLRRVAEESYQAAWSTVRASLEGLL